MSEYSDPQPSTPGQNGHAPLPAGSEPKAKPTGSTAMLVLDFQITDEQKKKLLEGLCRLITRSGVGALTVGVKSPGARVPIAQDPQLVCPRCKADRFKQPCGNQHSGQCPMVGVPTPPSVRRTT